MGTLKSVNGRQVVTPSSTDIPSWLTIRKGALTKIKTWRTDCRSQKLRFLALGDSNTVPIVETAGSSVEWGAGKLLDRALMMLRRNASLRPQGGTIKPCHQGGGGKPLDSYTKDGASTTLATNQIFRGDACTVTNLSGNVPAMSMGCVMPQKVGASHRIFYAILDLTVSGPLWLRDAAKVYVEYGANAPASGNAPGLPNNGYLLDGTQLVGAEGSIDFGTCVVDLIDGTGLSTSNPLSAGEMVILDAAAVLSSQTITLNGANANGFFWPGNVHATPITLTANKINILRFTPAANKTITIHRLHWEDSQTTGMSVGDATSSGGSDLLSRYFNYDSSGNVVYVGGNPVLLPYDSTMSYSSWLNMLEAVPNTPSHTILGCNGLFDFNFVNDLTNNKNPTQIAKAFEDKCTKMEASTSGAKGIVVKVIWCPWAALANLDGFITGSGSGSNGFKYADYLSALQGVVSKFPNTAVVISLQDYWDNMLPSQRQLIYQDSGQFSPGSIELLHDNVFGFLSPATWTIEQLVNRIADNG